MVCVVVIGRLVSELESPHIVFPEDFQLTWTGEEGTGLERELRKTLRKLTAQDGL